MYYPSLFKLLAGEDVEKSGGAIGAHDMKIDDDGSEAEYEEYHDDEYEQDEDELRVKEMIR